MEDQKAKLDHLRAIPALTVVESHRQPCHILGMETSIIKAVLVEAGRPLRVQLYYVTVNHGEDPIFLFDEKATPDLVAATVIDTLTEEEARGFGFQTGDIRIVTDA
jgi:hypothetical protein